MYAKRLTLTHAVKWLTRVRVRKKFEGVPLIERQRAVHAALGAVRPPPPFVLIGHAASFTPY